MFPFFPSSLREDFFFSISICFSFGHRGWQGLSWTTTGTGTNKIFKNDYVNGQKGGPKRGSIAHQPFVVGFSGTKKKNKQNTRKETKILTRIPSIVLILHFLFLILRPNFLDFLQVPCLTLSLRGCPVLLDFTGLNTFPIGHSDLLFSALPDLPSWRHTEHTNSVQVDRVNTELNHPQLT